MMRVGTAIGLIITIAFFLMVILTPVVLVGEKEVNCYDGEHHVIKELKCVQKIKDCSLLELTFNMNDCREVARNDKG